MKKNSSSYKKIDESHNLLFVFVGEVLFFGSSWALLMAPRTASIVNYDDNYCWVLINTFASGLVPRQVTRQTIITTTQRHVEETLTNKLTKYSSSYTLSLP